MSSPIPMSTPPRHPHTGVSEQLRFQNGPLSNVFIARTGNLRPREDCSASGGEK